MHACQASDSNFELPLNTYESSGDNTCGECGEVARGSIVVHLRDKVVGGESGSRDWRRKEEQTDATRGKQDINTYCQIRNKSRN
jgi:hypothetical protein